MELSVVLRADDGGLLILQCTGELTGRSAPELREALRAAAGLPHERLVLDLAGLECVDAAGLGVLLAAPRRLRDGQSLGVRGARGQVALALAVSGVDRVLAA